MLLGIISKDFTIDNMKKKRKKKIGLNRVVKVFSFYYNAVNDNDISDIHRYLIKET